MTGARSRVGRVLMTGPLAPFAEAYGVELKNRGYTRDSQRAASSFAAESVARGEGTGRG